MENYGMRPITFHMPNSLFERLLKVSSALRSMELRPLSHERRLKIRELCAAKNLPETKAREMEAMVAKAYEVKYKQQELKRKQQELNVELTGTRTSNAKLSIKDMINEALVVAISAMETAHEMAQDITDAQEDFNPSEEKAVNKSIELYDEKFNTKVVQQVRNK